MTPERLDVEQALPRMQALASRTWSPGSRHHPGQLAVLGLGPAYVLDDAWAWLESLDWLEVCGTDPAGAGTEPSSQAAKKSPSPSSSRSTSLSSL